MGRSFFIRIVIILLSFALFSCGSSKDEDAKTYKWKMQAFVNSNHFMYRQFAEPFVDLLKKRSNGRFEITVFPADAIVSNKDITKAVASGAVDAGYNSAAYDNGIIPETYVLTNLPMSFPSEKEAQEFWYEYRDGVCWDMIVEQYSTKGVHLEALLNFYDPQAFMNMFKVSKLSDFTGKKIRATGKWSEVIMAIGATQVNMSLGEIYTGLQTNVIDGLEMAITGLEDYKWKEIIKCVVLPPLQSGASTTFIINPDSYNGLSDEMKKLLNETINDTLNYTLIPFCQNYFTQVRASAEEFGVEFVTLTGEELNKYIEATEALWIYAEGLGENNATLVRMLKEYLDSKGLIYPGKTK